MENYSDRYERLKSAGAVPAFTFMPKKIEKEEYRLVQNIHVYNIYPNRYFISNYGNIYDALLNRFINQTLDKDGYLTCSIICLDRYMKLKVHRLELIVFKYTPDYANLQVNHIDGNHSNNMLSNLEWCNSKENSDHAMLYGLHRMNGSDNPNSKFTKEQVREICELIQSGKYYDTEIAKMYNVSYATISDIHNKKIWISVGNDYNMDIKKPKKLTENQVREICKLLETKKYSISEIAKMYNTSKTTIGDIRDGKIWNNISSEYDISYYTKPKKFTKEQVREICELIQSGKYYDTEIAKMYNTNPTFISNLRKGIIHKDISKDYDMSVRKSL